MRRMLIHHIEFIFKFNKPVSIKQLPYDSVFVTAVLIKKLILKKDSSALVVQILSQLHILLYLL